MLEVWKWWKATTHTIGVVKIPEFWSSRCVTAETIRLVSIRMQVWSLASLSGSGIWRCPELWCRSQTWLGSCVAVVVVQASSCSSNLTPSLGTSICWGCGPEKQKIKFSSKYFPNRSVGIILKGGMKMKKMHNLKAYKCSCGEKVVSPEFYFYLFFCLYPQHTEVPRPGIETTYQQWPQLLQR